MRVWTVDVKQAFLQGTTDDMRKLWLEAPEELNLEPVEVLQLMKPLYGTVDAGDRWHHRLLHHHLSDLKMKSLITDSALHAKFDEKDGNLVGLSGTYVDDILRCGHEKFQQLSEKTSDVFQTTPAIFDHAMFARVSLLSRKRIHD